MKLVKWISIGVAAAVLVGGVIVVNARAAAGAPMSAALEVNGAGALGQGRLAQQLGLTPDQRKQIRAILAADREKLLTLATTIHDDRITLRQTIRTPGASENEIRGASARVASAEADLAVERATLYGRISPILTADQLARLHDLQERADEAVDGAIGALGRRLAE